MGFWFVAVAVVQQGTGSSGSGSSGGGGATPGWWPVVGVVLVAVGGLAGLVAVLIQRGRRSAGAKIEAEQQDMIQKLLIDNKELRSQVLDLHTRIESMEPGKIEAQAMHIKWLEERLASVREEANFSQERDLKPNSSALANAQKQSEIIGGLTEAIQRQDEHAKDQDERLRKRDAYIAKLEKELEDFRRGPRPPDDELDRRRRLKEGLDAVEPPSSDKP